MPITYDRPIDWQAKYIGFRYNPYQDATRNWLRFSSQAAGPVSKYGNTYVNPKNASRRMIAWAKERGAKWQNGVLVMKDKKSKVKYQNTKKKKSSSSSSEEKHQPAATPAPATTAGFSWSGPTPPGKHIPTG